MNTPFRKVERVRFDKNPLHEVICQVRFDGPLGKGKFNSQHASLFHDAIRKSFPFFERRDVSNYIQEDEETDSKLIEKIEFRYLSDDRKFLVNLTDEFLAISTLNYAGWEVFFKEVNAALSALSNHLGKQSFSRVGLRYRDIIGREELGFDKDEPWKNLIRRDLLPVCLDDSVNKCIKNHESRFLVELNENEEKLAAEIVSIEGRDNHQEYMLIDADFFFGSEVTDVDGARKILESFNGYARDFFRWTITDTLYAAMAPKKI